MSNNDLGAKLDNAAMGLMSEQDRERLRREYLAAMGITVWLPRNRDGDAPAPSVASPLPEPPPKPTQEIQPAAHVAPPTLSAGSLDWVSLESAVRDCRQCTLCETRTQTVFGVGSQSARWMFVGEAPGADEDAQGEPFVGRAGQLLNAMLFASGLKREEVYIANVLKCRPPGNRDPQPNEVASCEPYLIRQIELIRPALIIALGRHAAHSLLKTESPLSRLRGQTLSYQGTPLVATYHPAYLLRNPADKGKAWEDLRRARRLVERA